MRKLKVLPLFFGLIWNVILVSGCSESQPNEHEQLYSDTADSLEQYKDLPDIKIELDTSEMTRDITRLTFDEFKNKYKVDDHTVSALSLSILTTLSIAKTFQSIEENIEDVESLNLDELQDDADSLEGEYSFNKVLPLSHDPETFGTSDSEIEYVIYE